MANLFKYMNAAYERLEKETREALQAESHSSAFADACTEYFGQNFEITQEPKRLNELLSNLHKPNVHLLILRLMGGHCIKDCIETDKKDLYEQPKSREGRTLALFEDTESEKGLQSAPTPTKGKNYNQNKKRAERKKRQRATRVEYSRLEVAENTSDLLKEEVDNSEASDERHYGSIQEDENIAHISQDCKKSLSSKYFQETDSNPATVIEDVDTVHSAESTEQLNKSNVEDNVPVSPAAKQSMKIDYTNLTSISKASGPLSPSPVVSDSAGKQVAIVALGDLQDQKSSYQYEEHLEHILEKGEDHNWTQVVGSRKKSKNGNWTNTSPNVTNASPATGSSQFSQQVSKPQGSGKLGTAFDIAPSPTRRVRVIPAVNEPPCSHVYRYKHLPPCRNSKLPLNLVQLRRILLVFDLLSISVHADRFAEIEWIDKASCGVPRSCTCHAAVYNSRR
jgi:hypothetical protein